MSSSDTDVLFLMMDSVRKDAVSGETMPQLIDRFEENWVNYEFAFANAPWTLPSHASIFTGKLPREHTATAHSKSLPKEIPTLAENFRERGYSTRLISNNMYLSSTFGMDRGFEQVLMELETKLFPDDTGMFLRERLKKSDNVIDAISQLISEGGFKSLVNLIYKYSQGISELIGPDDTGAEKMIDYFLKQEHKYSFTFFNFMEAHLPYEPPEPFKSEFCPDRYTIDELDSVNQNHWEFLLGETNTDFEGLRSQYHGSVAYLDSKFDYLLDELDRSGDLDDMIIVLCGDHGDHFGEHGLQGHVGSLHRELVHVPLYIRFPNGKWGGESISEAVSLRQLYTSLITWSGGETPSLTGVPEPLPSPGDRDNCSHSQGVVSEYMGVQDLNVPEEGMSKYDRRLTAVHNSLGYVVASEEEIQHQSGECDKELLTELLDGVPDNVTDADDNEIPDNVKDRLEAVGYVQ